MPNSPAGYTIEVIKEAPDSTAISLHLDDVNSLPDALKELARMGLDLGPTAFALHEVEAAQKRKEAEQRKRDQEEVMARVQEACDRAKGERRFVIGWLDEDDRQRGVITRKGTEFADGHILLDHGGNLPDHYSDLATLQAVIMRCYRTSCTSFAFIDSPLSTHSST